MDTMIHLPRHGFSSVIYSLGQVFVSLSTFLAWNIFFHLLTQTPPREFRCSQFLTWAALGICCHYWNPAFFPQLSRSIIVKILESKDLRHQLTSLACLYVQLYSFILFIYFSVAFWGYILYRFWHSSWFFNDSQSGGTWKWKPEQTGWESWIQVACMQACQSANSQLSHLNSIWLLWKILSKVSESALHHHQNTKGRKF